jgi:hypothetical protein
MNTGSLVAALLHLGAADDVALWPVTSGPADWDDHWMVGTINADEVGVIAAAQVVQTASRSSAVRREVPACSRTTNSRRCV